MPKYVPLDLPPGVVANGTKRSRRGQWIDGDRIRWEDNAIRPIGGWDVFATEDGELDQVVLDPANEKARASLAYRLNDGTGMFVAATNQKLYAWGRSTSDVADITPVDFTPRSQEVVSLTGYGMGDYGADAYGTERTPDEFDQAKAFSWCLRTWGEDVLAAPRGAPSKLYTWDTNFANVATVVTNAPEDFDCFHVTNERMVMVAGEPTDPRMVQWSDREDNEEWTISSTTTAGFQRLEGKGRFLDIVTVKGGYLLVSETDAYLATYLGAPFIYGFTKVGNNCGAISANSVVTTEDFAIWPGTEAFYLFDGSVVRAIDCAVMDRLTDTINSAQSSKTYGYLSPSRTEIWWHYQEGATDVDSYVFYNWSKNYWSVGTLDRTTGAAEAVTGHLVMIGQDGLAYSHELYGVVPSEVSSSDVFVESGPIVLSNNDTTQYVEYILPDYQFEGQVNVTLFGQDRPGGPEIAFGPYLIDHDNPSNQPVPCRARGHSIRYRIEGASGTWAQGSCQLSLKMGGAK